MRLTPSEFQERKENIIQNAFLLFRKCGIEAVSMTEISKQSDVGRSALFRYFGNKENLVLEAFLKLWDTIMSELEISLEMTEGYSFMTGFEQIRLWIEHMRALDEMHNDFILFSYEAKLYLLRRNIKLSREQQDGMIHAIRKPCIAALNKGKADGSINSKEDSEDLFYSIWGSIRGYIVKIVIYNYLCGIDSPWEKRYPVLENCILRSLCSDWDSRNL